MVISVMERQNILPPLKESDLDIFHGNFLCTDGPSRFDNGSHTNRQSYIRFIGV